MRYEGLGTYTGERETLGDQEDILEFLAVIIRAYPRNPSISDKLL